MSCRRLTCNPGKVFCDDWDNYQCSSLTRKWLQEIKHWIRNHFFLSFSEPPLVIKAILGIIKLDMLVQVFQLVAPLPPWNSRKTHFSDSGNFSVVLPQSISRQHLFEISKCSQTQCGRERGRACLMLEPWQFAVTFLCFHCLTDCLKDVSLSYCSFGRM